MDFVIDVRQMEDIERELLQHHREDDAAGAIRSVAERTRDFVPVLGRVVQALNVANLEDSPLFDDLRVRLELGVQAEIVALARVAGSRLTRADYRRLHAAGLTTADSVAACSSQQLQELLGDAGKASVLGDLVSADDG